jgi:endonuclease/exonuclease/phosphatase family metal-dependent hydrolase
LLVSLRIKGRAPLQSLDAEIICLQESFDVHHRRLFYAHLGVERYYASGGFAATRHAPLASFDTTGGLVIFSKFPILQAHFTPFNQFTPSVIERIGRKGVLEATIATPSGPLQVLNMHLHGGTHVLARRIRFKQLKRVVERLHVPRNMPAIVAGDFNEHILMEQPHVVKVLQSRHLLHACPGEPSPWLPSYRVDNPLVNNWLNRSQYSRRLDYIFVSFPEACGMKVVQYEPMYLRPPLSDHDPVLLALSSDSEGAAPRVRPASAVDSIGLSIG